MRDWRGGMGGILLEARLAVGTAVHGMGQGILLGLGMRQGPKKSCPMGHEIFGSDIVNIYEVAK